MLYNRDTNPQNTTQLTPTLPDDLTWEKEPDPTLTTTEEERRGTIPGSNEATAMALAGQQATANPVVERSKPRKVKKTAPSTSKGHTSTQTESQQPITKQ